MIFLELQDYVCYTFLIPNILRGIHTDKKLLQLIYAMGGIMIPYSLNNGIRKQFTVILVLISICITILLENVFMPYFICFDNQSELFNTISSLKAFELLIAVTVPPFLVWWLVNFLYSKYLWKLPFCQLFHHIPNLNGKWNGYTMNDKNQNRKRSVSVVIKQDWNTIWIQTEIIDSNKKSDVQSFCECTVAAIDINCGEIKLKYAYKNMLLGEESYVGYNELRIEKNRIFGQYITTKPTKGVFDICRDE